MIHEILPVGLLQCNCSIFGDEQNHEAIVVDPGDDLEDIHAMLTKHGLTVKAIIVTHAHIDHVAGAAKLRAQTGAPVYMNERDNALLDMLDVQAAWIGMENPQRTEVDQLARDGTVLQLGNAEFQVRETPGHTPGSICLWIPQENTLVAGDTLFRDSIGRTDLPGGDSKKIITSIEGQLMNLPPDALVIPGHGRNTTIGREKAHNPFLQGSFS
jgi:glyoxylase-like metal-dependent hydrolase (beta-lactamase superfamily II)